MDDIEYEELMKQAEELINTSEHVFIRLFRDGKWKSVSIAELTFITEDEVNTLPWKTLMTAMLNNCSDWKKVSYGWIREGKAG